MISQKVHNMNGDPTSTNGTAMQYAVHMQVDYDRGRNLYTGKCIHSRAYLDRLDRMQGRGGWKIKRMPVRVRGCRDAVGSTIHAHHVANIVFDIFGELTALTAPTHPTVVKVRRPATLYD